MTNALEIIFENKPLTWGLRGDPHLWDELKQALTGTSIPGTSGELKELLYNQFGLLAGEPPVRGKNISVERYLRLGMSGGLVCSDYWINKGFPILLERYEKVLKNETLMHLPHGLSQEGILLLAMLSFKQINSWDGGMRKIYEWQNDLIKFSLLYDRGYFDCSILSVLSEYSFNLLWFIRFILNDRSFYERELIDANLWNTLTPDGYVQLLYNYYPLYKNCHRKF